jgi:hypothetical protein
MVCGDDGGHHDGEYSNAYSNTTQFCFRLRTSVMMSAVKMTFDLSLTVRVTNILTKVTVIVVHALKHIGGEEVKVH